MFGQYNHISRIYFRHLTHSWLQQVPGTFEQMAQPENSDTQTGHMLNENFALARALVLF